MKSCVWQPLFAGGAFALLFFALCGGARAQHAAARPSRSNAAGQRGVVYQARDLRTGKVYVGEAASGDHLKARERTYVERGNRGGAYEFRILEEPRRGDLRVREEHHLRAAIAEYGREMVENKISALRAERYDEALRERERETAAERRARLERFERERFERGKQAADRREKRLAREREAGRRLERQRQEQERRRRDAERRGPL